MPERTALVVDDSRLARMLARKSLESMGYAVTEAAGGPEALALLTGNGGADVALIDRNMPEMDGTDLVKEIRDREHLRAMKLILVSAVEEAEGNAEAVSVGSDAFLAKPWTKESLGQTLDRLDL